MKKYIVFIVSMVAVLNVSCKRSELKDEGHCRISGPVCTIRFGEIEFDLDDHLSDLNIRLEIISEVNDEAYVLISLHDEIEDLSNSSDSITKLLKGYKGYSIEQFSIRSYGLFPFCLGWYIPFIVPDEQYEYLLTKDWFSELPILPVGINWVPEGVDVGYYPDGLKYIKFEEGLTPYDFPVYLKKIQLKKGKNVDQIHLKFEQRIRSGNWNFPVNDPIISLSVLRWNNQIKTQIENYPFNYQPSLVDRINYNQYFKVFPDSSISSFVFSNAQYLWEMSKLTDGNNLFDDSLRDFLDDGYYNMTHSFSRRLTSYIGQERYNQTLIPIN